MELEYKLSKALFDGLLSTRKKGEKKQNPYKYVMDLINQEYGLRGTVVKLHVI